MPTAEHTEKYGKILRGKAIPEDPYWRQDLEYKFWRKVTKGEDHWLFQGQPRPDKPYAEFCHRYTKYWIHHVAYQLQHGPIPEGAMVLHTCDIGLCVRGEHLYLGDHSANLRDAWRNRRTNGTSVLSDEQVQEIRILLKEGKHTQAILALMYKVPQATISRINTGKSYGRVG